MSSAQAFQATRREPTPAICTGQFLHKYTRKLGMIRKIFAILPHHLIKIQEQMGNTVNTSSKKNLLCTLWVYNMVWFHHM